MKRGQEIFAKALYLHLSISDCVLSVLSLFFEYLCSSSMLGGEVPGHVSMPRRIPGIPFRLDWSSVSLFLWKISSPDVVIMLGAGVWC